MKVIKRNGKEACFDKNKIKLAVMKAIKEVKPDKDKADIELDAIYISSKVSDVLFNQHLSIADIEQIQDIVEETLMDYDKTVAKAYITYRYKHTLERNKYTNLMNGVREKVLAKNVKNQNANVDEYSFGGRKGEMADFVAKEYALNELISPMAKNNHLNNMIYIHDLNAYSTGEHNCMTLPIDELLKNGFNCRQVDIRPAQSINTAMQLLAVLFQIQSLQQFGGVSASHLDWSMVPYVRKSFYRHFLDGVKFCYETELKSDFIITKDNCDTYSIEDEYYKSYSKAYNFAMYKTEKELNQSTEGLYHNLNSLQSRSGNQLPFSSINYGTCVLTEGRMVIKALLNSSIKGIGKLHKTSIFPCGIFKLKKGINRKQGDPNYDLFQLALKSTALRLYPNYANCDWSGNAGYNINNPQEEFSTMGKCKLQLI